MNYEREWITVVVFFIFMHLYVFCVHSSPPCLMGMSQSPCLAWMALPHPCCSHPPTTSLDFQTLHTLIIVTSQRNSSQHKCTLPWETDDADWRLEASSVAVLKSDAKWRSFFRSWLVSYFSLVTGKIHDKEWTVFTSFVNISCGFVVVPGLM